MINQPPRHPIGSRVYVTCKLESKYMELGTVNRYITAQLSDSCGYWVEIDGSGFENIYFDDEIQVIKQDFKPAFASFRTIMELARNGLLEPLADPLGAIKPSTG